MFLNAEIVNLRISVML